ncbi:MAG: hypothetical protein LBK67_09005, partial [Coriobacteriales bacterium]|nr:hypothetical protein [Coriobacteriales bacterium]
QQPEASEALDVPEGARQPEEPAAFDPLGEPELELELELEPATPSFVTMDGEAPAGEGTEDSPYLIANVANLQWMRTMINDTTTTDGYRDKHYRLTADIDMTGVENWGPIGVFNANGSPVYNRPFIGTFDGNNKTISHMSMRGSSGNLAFFGPISGATIKDLALVDMMIINASAGGQVAGIATSVSRFLTLPVTISGCYVSGTITSGGLAVGGIVGSIETGVTIENCRVDGSVRGAYNIGGIVGHHYLAAASTIRNCLVTATLEGAETGGNVGGIFGWDNSSGILTVENCRVLSQSISTKSATTIGAIYGFITAGSGNAPAIITDASAWKGLMLDGTPLKEILYGDALYNTARNGETILSWKLALQEGWPAGLTSGAWSYTEGKIPVLTSFAGKMSNEFPTYMSGYLTPPGTVDKTALEEAIQEADDLPSSQNPDGWDDFQLALVRVKLVLGDDESSQAELDAAVKSLEDATELIKSRNALELEGEGTEGNPYKIANVALLQKMNRLVNSSDGSYRDKYYQLTADIDMADESWLPLGRNAVTTAFTGTFDGNGKTISNLTISGTSYVGMFGYINNATIMNLNLKDYDIQSTSDYTAALVASSAGTSTITGCKVSGTINGNWETAGIIARVTGSITIEKCSVDGTIRTVFSESSVGDVAGIIGFAQGGTGSTIVVKDCVVSADIVSQGSYAGGIAGRLAPNNVVTISNCKVTLSGEQSITGENYVSGIAGLVSNDTTVENCTVTGGAIRSSSVILNAFSGSLVGSIPNNATVKLKDCFAQTNIEAVRGRAGGLIGEIQTTSGGDVKVTNCAFIGSVTGTEYIGGFAGYGTRFTMTDCFIKGQITGTRYVGGILGTKHNNGNVKIEDSYTMTNVQGNEYVGGVLGQQYTAGLDTGIFNITDCRILGEAVTRVDFSTALTFGALSGDAQYGTASYVMTNTFAWAGMKLDEKTLADTTAGDPLFSVDKNGLGFLNWALRSASGWPESLTNNSGAWSYSAGGLPVLTKFKNQMSSEFPTYMENLPNSGTAGDKVGLRAAITAAEALQSSDEIAMWAELQKQLTFAHQAEDLYDASQATIDAARVALEAATTEYNRLNNLIFGGAGTADSPYEISSLDLLLKMNRVVNSTDITIRNKYRVAHYKLTADVDLAGLSWLPLGGTANGTAFTGGFDGGGKTISNLKLNGTTYLGFFGYVNGATIKGLTLKDFSIEGTNTIGSIAAYCAATTTIRDCAVSGTIIATAGNIGGIAGYLPGTTISGCVAEVDISASGYNVGGIAGDFSYGTIEGCSVRNYSTGGAIVNNLTWSAGYAGGIAGGIGSASATNITTIRDCQVQANIVGVNVGGMVGYASSSGAVAGSIVISGCWFDGTIASSSAIADANLGGIAGTMINNCKITDCRTDGTIIMAASAGGILGRFSGLNAVDLNIDNCYTTMRIGNGGMSGGLVGHCTTGGTGKL